MRTASSRGPFAFVCLSSHGDGEEVTHDVRPDGRSRLLWDASSVICADEYMRTGVDPQVPVRASLCRMIIVVFDMKANPALVAWLESLFVRVIA